MFWKIFQFSLFCWASPDCTKARLKYYCLQKYEKLGGKGRTRVLLKQVIQEKEWCHEFSHTRRVFLWICDQRECLQDDHLLGVAVVGSEIRKNKDENGGTFQKDSFNSHKKSRILPSSFPQTYRKIHARQPKKCRTAESVKSCIQSKSKEECFKNTERRGDVMYSDKREGEWFRGSSRKEWMNIVNLLVVAVFGSEIRRKGEKIGGHVLKWPMNSQKRLWCKPARFPKMVGSSKN